MMNDEPRPLWPALASAGCLLAEVVALPVIGGITYAFGASLAEPGDLLAVAVILLVLVVGGMVAALVGGILSVGGLVLGVVHLRRGRLPWLGGVLAAVHGLVALGLLSLAGAGLLLLVMPA